MWSRFSHLNPKNHFPIVAQLGILLLFLTGLFAVLLLPEQSETTAPIPASLPSPETTDMTFAYTLTDVSISAKAAYVYDVSTGAVLYSKDSETAYPLASLTKLMTTLLAHEMMTGTTTTEVPAAAARQESSLGLQAGEQFTFDQLSHMALIASSNDAAHTIAMQIGAQLGNADEALQFATAMNIRAEELGLDTLQFYNATGLDLSLTEAGAYGSAADVSRLMGYIVTTYPELITPSIQTNERIYNAMGDYRDITNTNKIANAIPRLLGSKTGYTDLAGGNLTVVFDVGYNRPVVVTVLQASYDTRFSDVATLVAAVTTAMSTTN